MLLAAFIFLNILSASFIVDVPVAERYFAITVYLAIFAVWLAGYVDSPRRARLVLLGLLITGVTLSTAACVSLFVGGVPLASRLTGAGRAQGLFHDPNIFGPFMVVLALFVLEELLEPRLLHVRRSFKFLLLLACGAGVLFSFSRAAWLNAAVGVFAMLVVVALRRRRRQQGDGDPRHAARLAGRAGGLRLGHRLGELPQRASAPSELRHLALQRAGDGAAARRGLPVRGRARSVRVLHPGVHAQRLHPRTGRAGRARAGDGVRRC